MNSLVIPGFEAHGFETPIERDAAPHRWPRPGPVRLAWSPDGGTANDAAPVNDPRSLRCVNAGRRALRR
jgi:hypothetical protein